MSISEHKHASEITRPAQRLEVFTGAGRRRSWTPEEKASIAESFVEGSTACQVASDPVVVQYTLSEKDVDGPFLDEVPTKLDKMKGLKALSYGSSRERISERFHSMSEGVLSELNPGQKFDRKGDQIFVVKGLSLAHRAMDGHAGP